MCIFCGRWFCSSWWDGGCCAWAAALGLLRWAPFTVEGQLLGATFSSSLRCVSFVIEAVCSMACSVLARFTMFWIFSRRFPGAVCFSLFHCEAMTLLAVSTFTVGVCSFSFSRGPFRVPLRGTGLLLSCSRSTFLDSAFFAAESASSCH